MIPPSAMIDPAPRDEEAVMNILFWYLPFAMFTGVCDVLISESDAQTESHRPAEGAEPPPRQDRAWSE